jgi:hypothetical protein
MPERDSFGLIYPEDNSWELFRYNNPPVDYVPGPYYPAVPTQMDSFYEMMQNIPVPSYYGGGFLPEQEPVAPVTVAPYFL